MNNLCEPSLQHNFMFTFISVGNETWKVPNDLTMSCLIEFEV